MPDISELPIRYPIYRKFRYDAQFCQVMLYTYTDKDGFVPPSQVNGGGLTTGEGGPHSYLEEAVVNMPRNVATPSINAESSGRDGGGGKGRSQERLRVLVKEAIISQECPRLRG